MERNEEVVSLLYPATYDDRYLVWSIFGDVVSRASYCFMAGSMSFSQYLDWFIYQISSQNSFFYIIKNSSQEFCGYVRVFVKDGVGEISIALSDDCTNMGIGTRAIEDCCRIVNQAAEITIIANVRSENTRSIKAFLKAGFVAIEQLVLKHHKTTKLVFLKQVER